MISNKAALKKKCLQIKIVISDVDGVLTDGGMFFSENGEVLKKFMLEMHGSKFVVKKIRKRINN